MKRGHGEASLPHHGPSIVGTMVPIVPHLSIHGKSVIDQPIALSEFLGDSSQDFFGLGLLS